MRRGKQERGLRHTMAPLAAQRDPRSSHSGFKVSRSSGEKESGGPGIRNKQSFEEREWTNEKSHCNGSTQLDGVSPVAERGVEEQEERSKLIWMGDILESEKSLLAAGCGGGRSCSARTLEFGSCPQRLPHRAPDEEDLADHFFETRSRDRRRKAGRKRSSESERLLERESERSGLKKHRSKATRMGVPGGCESAQEREALFGKSGQINMKPDSSSRRCGSGGCDSRRETTDDHASSTALALLSVKGRGSENRRVMQSDLMAEETALRREDVWQMSALQKHKLFCGWLGRTANGRSAGREKLQSSKGDLCTTQLATKSDYALLKESHKFLRSDEDLQDSSWESRLAQRYYDKLFKEYVICDLTRYKTGQVGFRWRTEAEVLDGRGQFWCASKNCGSRCQLQSYEVDFVYTEHGAKKRAFVKCRVCIDCAFKLFYKRLKKAAKTRCKLLARHKELRACKKRRRNSRLAVADDASFDREHSVSISGASSDTSSDSAMPRNAKARSVEKTSAVTDKAADSRNDSGEESESNNKPHFDEMSLRDLELLRWKGPEQSREAKDRNDEFEDYLADMFV